MTKRLYLNKKMIDKAYYYVDMGHGYHGKNDFRLWVNRKFIFTDDEDRPYINLPLKNAKLEYGKSKYTVKLLPSENTNVFDIFIECGYRGGSRFEVENVPSENMFKYEKYHSETGSLGVSNGALIVTELDKLTVSWNKTGRLYGGASNGKFIIDTDGNYTELGNIDLDELEDL